MSKTLLLDLRAGLALAWMVGFAVLAFALVGIAIAREGQRDRRGERRGP